MFKLILRIIFCSSLILSSGAIAQGLFEPFKKQAPAATDLLPPVSTTPIAPSDFANKVSGINAQNEAAFKQQLNQKLAQAKSSSALAPPPPVASSSTSKSSGSGTATTTDTSATPSTDTPEAIQETAPAAPRQSTNSAATSPPKIATPSTPQKQIYTGFQGGSSNTSGNSSTPSSNTNSKPGWNIQY